MFSFVYTVALHLLALLWIPSFLYQYFRYGKYKHSVKQRLGIGFPFIEKKGFLVWIHAVSVGETKAIAPLIARLKKERPDVHIVLSNITENGHLEALRSLPQVDNFVYLPFDLPYIIKPIVHRTSPDLVILVETDFWYHFQSAAKECGASIVVVNGKISKKSLCRYRLLPWLTAPIFHCLDLLFVQTEEYRLRFLQLGIPPSHLIVAGNIKLDGTYPTIATEDLKNRLGIYEGDFVICIGSTHDPEERWLLTELKKIWRRHPEVKALLAPRHPERVKAIISLLQKQEIPFALWNSGEKMSSEVRLLLVDVVGQLRTLYQLCDVAIVAGSFTDKVGGHHLLEPSFYGKPVIFGPHTHAQSDFAEALLQGEGGIEVEADEVAKVVIKLIENPILRHSLGESGRRICEASQGATERIWNQLRCRQYI